MKFHNTNIKTKTGNALRRDITGEANLLKMDPFLECIKPRIAPPSKPTISVQKAINKFVLK
jgi:hypothetical protein